MPEISEVRAPRLSIVVPTYKEAENVRTLCLQVTDAFRGRPCELEEILVMDDASSESEATSEQVADLPNVRYVLRSADRGLSKAVVDGMNVAKGDAFLVMDADLQHAPSDAPLVALPVLLKKCEACVGSRHVGNGPSIDSDWPAHRRLISWGANTLAKPLCTLSDPVSGFFCVDRSVFERCRESINPMGYKIGLELVVRSRAAKVLEVPITFGVREAGESKLTMKQNVLYAVQLSHLYLFKFGNLLLMGLISIIVGLIAYALVDGL